MKKALIVAGAMVLATLTTAGYAASPFGSGDQPGDAVGTPPTAVVDYVKGQPTPVSTALVEEPLVVGQPLSSHVVLVAVPDDPNFAYAIVNNQRVIVEPKSRRVVQIIQ